MIENTFKKLTVEVNAEIGTLINVIVPSPVDNNELQKAVIKIIKDKINNKDININSINICNYK